MEMVDRLAEHKTLGAAPRAELEWLAAHGSIRTLQTDEILSEKGRPVEALHILLSGRAALFADRGAGLTKIIEWRAGDVSGMLPYSRLVAPPGNSIVLEPTEILSIPREQLRAMTRECFEVTSILVHNMIDRSRLFTSSDLQNEKMISLGKLSAGLAHELNNPSAAIQRCASMLQQRLDDSEQAARVLAAIALTSEQVTVIDAVRAACMAVQHQPARSPLEQADREEAIADWLSRRGLDTVNAALLADTAVTFDSLDTLAASVDPPALNAVLRWSAAGCSIRGLSAMIQDSATHISNLLAAVKGFTHMDQVNTAAAVDLRLSLGNTVEVLRSKANERSATVSLEIEPDLPLIHGYAAELNQVWGNLIDNALDAVAHGGKVEVTAASENRAVLVRIIDNGPGIPADLRDRVFDPFFTTKPQGQAIGLGLDIARRLVRHNEGSIDFDSIPGRTEFRVRLPLAAQ
ncbi:MAG TPA: ATP-binding protein [Terracidiphilus sp.]|nr:ATP-binding protein [Terracidiphilus sp.]